MDLLLSGVGLGGVFHKLELLAVHLLGHAVETVVIAVEQHLDEAAARARAGFLLQGLMVRRGGEVVPKVGADAVAHAGTVDGHSVENPVVIVAQVEERAVNRVAVGIAQLYGIRFLGIIHRACAAILEGGDDSGVVDGDVRVGDAQRACDVVIAVGAFHVDFNHGEEGELQRSLRHFVARGIFHDGNLIRLFAAHGGNGHTARFGIGGLVCHAQRVARCVGALPSGGNGNRGIVAAAQGGGKRHEVLAAGGIVRKLLAVEEQRGEIVGQGVFAARLAASSTAAGTAAADGDAFLGEVIFMAVVGRGEHEGAAAVHGVVAEEVVRVFVVVVPIVFEQRARRAGLADGVAAVIGFVVVVIANLPVVLTHRRRAVLHADGHILHHIVILDRHIVAVARVDIHARVGLHEIELRGFVFVGRFVERIAVDIGEHTRAHVLDVIEYGVRAVGSVDHRRGKACVFPHCAVGERARVAIIARTAAAGRAAAEVLARLVDNRKELVVAHRVLIVRAEQVGAIVNAQVEPLRRVACTGNVEVFAALVDCPLHVFPVGCGGQFYTFANAIYAVSRVRKVFAGLGVLDAIARAGFLYIPPAIFVERIAGVVPNVCRLSMLRSEHERAA